MSNERLITISKETLRYFLTIVSAAIGVYIGMQRNMKDMRNDIDNTSKRVDNIELNVSNVNIGFMYQQQLVHGKYIDRLVPNQLSLARDCGKPLLMHFNDIRGIN
jgi:hypothetical protein